MKKPKKGKKSNKGIDPSKIKGINFQMTVIDNTKIEQLYGKRNDIIFELDKLRRDHMREELKLRNKVVVLDRRIEKEKKGKTTTKDFVKQNGSFKEKK